MSSYHELTRPILYFLCGPRASGGGSNCDCCSCSGGSGGGGGARRRRRRPSPSLWLALAAAALGPALRLRRLALTRTTKMLCPPLQQQLLLRRPPLPSCPGAGHSPSTATLAIWCRTRQRPPAASATAYISSSFRCRLLNSSCASRAPFALCFGLLHDLADWEFPIVSTPTAPDSLDRTDVLRVTPWTPSPLSRLPRTARLLLFSSLQSPLFHDWPRAHDYTFLYNSDAVCLCAQRGFAGHAPLAS